MKKLLFIFYQLIFCIELIAQTSFFKIYPSPVHHEIYSVIETDSGDFVCSGLELNVISKPYLFLSNSNGTFIKENIDLTENEATCSKLLKIASIGDNFYTFRNIHASPNDTLKILISDNNLEQTLISTFVFPDTFCYTVQDVSSLNDTALIIFLSRSTQITDFSLLKYNLSDNTFTLFTPEIYDVRIPIDLFVDEASQSIKVSCWGNRLRNEPANKIFTFDLDLNLLSTYVYPTYINSQLRICSFDDTSYLAYGSFYRPYDTQRLNTIRLNNNNTVVDSVELNYGYDTITLTSPGRGMLVTDSNIWVVGWYDVGTGFLPFTSKPNWIQLSRLDFDLNIISQHYYGGNGSYVAKDIIETSDNGILIAGYYFNPNAVPLLYQMDPFLLKTNSEGVVVSSNDHDPPIAQEAIVLPNPGTDYTQVKLAIQHQTALLQLFDIKGRLLLEKSIDNSLKRIDVSFLDKGTYVYRITADSKVIGSGKWIKL